jgi:lysozyme
MTLQLPDPALPWPIPMAAVALIAEAEGLRLNAYRCPAGVPTIGWGETDGVSMGDTCTKEQADKMLCDDLATRATFVRMVCTVKPGANELGAFVSLAYNIGHEAFKRSTALRLHNAGDHQGASRAICLFDKARVNGALTALPGLTARRAREQALYLTPDAPSSEPMPQAVEPESSIVSSQILQGGGITIGSGIVAALAEAREALGPVGEGIKAAKTFAADVLGVPPSWILPAVAIGAGLVVVRWRLAQRRNGWV